MVHVLQTTAEFGHFTLLLCRGRQRNVQRIIMHVNSYSCSLNLLFDDVLVAVAVVFCVRSPLGSLSKPRRQRQRERHKTKGLMSKTIAVHVRYKSSYISLPSSAKRQLEMTKFCVVYRTWTTTVNFSYFHLELNAVVTYLASARF